MQMTERQKFIVDQSTWKTCEEIGVAYQKQFGTSRKLARCRIQDILAQFEKHIDMEGRNPMKVSIEFTNKSVENNRNKVGVTLALCGEDKYKYSPFLRDDQNPHKVVGLTTEANDATRDYWRVASAAFDTATEARYWAEIVIENIKRQLAQVRAAGQVADELLPEGYEVEI